MLIPISQSIPPPVPKHVVFSICYQPQIPPTKSGYSGNTHSFSPCTLRFCAPSAANMMSLRVIWGPACFAWVWRTEKSGSDQSPGSTWSLTLGAWREEREMMSYLLSREYIYLLSLPFPYLLFLQTYIQCWVCTRHIESDCHLPSGRVKSSGEQAVSVVKHSRDLWDLRDGQLYQMGGFLEVVLFELSLKG